MMGLHWCYCNARDLCT